MRGEKLLFCLDSHLNRQKFRVRDSSINDCGNYRQKDKAKRHFIYRSVFFQFLNNCRRNQRKCRQIGKYISSPRPLLIGYLPEKERKKNIEKKQFHLE